MDKTDLIIIGGGILGTFHAYAALKKGLTVRLFEKNKTSIGASIRNFGQIVPSGMYPEWQQLGRRSLTLYKELDNHIRNLQISQKGSTYIASNEEENILLQELHEINQRANYNSLLLTQQECISKIPALQPTYCKSGLHFPEEITVEPAILIAKVTDFLMEKYHLKYHHSTTIIEACEANQECSVVSNVGNSYRSTKIIICNGSELNALFPAIIANSDLEISQLQMLQTIPNTTISLPGNILTGLSIRRYESFRACPSYSTIKSKETDDDFNKKWGIHLLFKQNSDGSIILGDSHEYADAKNADELDYALKETINEHLISEAQKILSLPSWKIARKWLGRYSQSKSKGIFLNQPSANIHIVTGIGGKGMTAGPGFAEKYLNELCF